MWLDEKSGKPTRYNVYRRDVTAAFSESTTVQNAERYLRRLGYITDFSGAHRKIRLTYLIPEFLEKMDNGEIALSVGVELSFLGEQSQRDVLEQCAVNDCTPSYSQAWRMHKADRVGKLDGYEIMRVMSEEKANDNSNQ